MCLDALDLLDPADREIVARRLQEESALAVDVGIDEALDDPDIGRGVTRDAHRSKSTTPRHGEGDDELIGEVHTDGGRRL